MSEDYTLKYSGAFGKSNKNKIKPKTLDILGDCVISNYDTKTNNKPDGAISIFLENGKIEINESSKNDQTPDVADFSEKKAEILEKISMLDGEKALSFKDILMLKKDLIKKWAIKDLRFDFKHGVATVIWGENDILKIDFKTKSEKTENSNIKESQKNKKISKKIIVKEALEKTQVKGDSVKFLQDLGGQETKGKKNPYACINDYGYVGLYQMGEQAMAEMGIYKKKKNSKTGKPNYNNDWKGIFVKNKYGITSLSDYRNSPEKQHALQRDYKKNDWKYIKNLKLDKYLGKIINGVRITESGLLAGAHLKGVGGLQTYLASNGKKDIKDRTGTPISKYIKQFSDYDISDIIN